MRRYGLAFDVGLWRGSEVLLGNIRSPLLSTFQHLQEYQSIQWRLHMTTSLMVVSVYEKFGQTCHTSSCLTL